jgi:DNA adenine methylase
MPATQRALKSPFPYFGGKSRVAAGIWERFGDVPNYVEPFAGSLAVLLARPYPPGTETVNDLDGWLTNFWRAVRQDPDRVAAWADYPVSELDLHARGDWLFYREQAGEFVERMRADPEFCCFKSAGWWLWGACSWIGTGWGRKLPHVGDAGRGVNRKLPHVGNAGMGEECPTREALREYMRALSVRLRRVRVVCGDWERVTGPSVTARHGTTAVFLDPPYGEGEMDYAAGGNATTIASEVRDWALSVGDDPAYRVALCGYEGAEMPASWECFAWKNRGGYGSQGDGEGRENARRERIWFSPRCVKPGRSLFDGFDTGEGPP